MTVYEEALAAVARGWPVIPVEPRGKQVNGLLCKRGSADCSLDPEQLKTWFAEHPDRNYGIVAGREPKPPQGYLVFFDIDDNETAQIFIENDLATATSGRAGGGAHVYYYTPNLPATHDVFAEGHKKLGEIRSTNAYVVGPGSTHPTGTVYAWVSDPDFVRTVTDVHDEVACLIKLFCGVNVEPPGQGKPGSASDYAKDFPKGSLVATGLPLVIEADPGSSDLRTAYSTPLGIPGSRSTVLHYIANELVRRCKALNLNLTHAQIAGVLKGYDQAQVKPKFARKANADAQYAREAAKVMGPAVPDIAGVISVQSSSTAPFMWDDNRHQLIIQKGQQTAICNFKAMVAEEVTVITGSKPERRIIVRCERDEENVEFIKLTAKDINSKPALIQAIRSQLPAHYHVYADGYQHFYDAAMAMSEYQFEQRVEYAETGWTSTGAYMLPSTGGGITATGIDDTLTFESPADAHLTERVYLFGKGCRPLEEGDDTAAAELALNTLLHAAEPRVLLPVLSQVMAGPLAEHVGSRYVVHVYGRTGLLKTAFATTVMSLFGHFVEVKGSIRNPLIVDTWISTPYALQGLLYTARQVTVLIDDYKESTIRNRSGITTLLQAYADGTARSRANVDGSIAKAKLPRGLILSTGEDVWEDQESSPVRTILVPLADDSVSPLVLGQAQEYADSGMLAALGTSWVQWLARIGLEEAQKRLDAYTAELSTLVRKDVPAEIHNRMVTNLVQLLAMGWLIRGWIVETFPSLSKRYTEICQQATPALLAEMVEHGVAAAELSPFQQLRDWLVAGIQLKKLMLKPTKAYKTTKILGGDNPVGLYDQSAVYINKAMTYTVYKESLARQRESCTFSWNAFNDFVRKLGGETSHSLRTEHGSIKMSRIPIEELFPEGYEQWEEETTTFDFGPSLN